MNQVEHEKVLLQMLKEIQARGTIFTGDIGKVNWLMKNDMIKRSQLKLPGSQRGQVRYSITDVGAGLVAHLITKHANKGNPDASPVERTEAPAVGTSQEAAHERDAGSGEDCQDELRRQGEGDVRP